MTKKHLSTILSYLLLVLIGYFGSVGIRETYNNLVAPPVPATIIEREQATDTGWQLNEPSESAEFITGPLAASVGELCVFRLNDPGTKADWIIVPSATCYIDSSGSSLAFASNVPATYTIIAAIVEDGVPKILTHVCEYGVSPEPTPSPPPSPTPHPTPTPANLTEWVTKNIPEDGQSQCAALASCYEATAEAIEKNTIRTTEAAFSTLRTATQTKIKPDIWGPFLDQLVVKVTERLDGSNDVRKLGVIFSEITNGLKAVSDNGDESPLSESNILSEVLKLPLTSPAMDFVSPPNVRTDPTERTPTIQPRRQR